MGCCISMFCRCAMLCRPTFEFSTAKYMYECKHVAYLVVTFFKRYWHSCRPTPSPRAAASMTLTTYKAGQNMDNKIKLTVSEIFSVMTTTSHHNAHKNKAYPVRTVKCHEHARQSQHARHIQLLERQMNQELRMCLVV